MGQTALVLTAEAAEEAGLTGGGPFTFPGFPGVYAIDAPVAVSELRNEDAPARAEELGLPLSTVTVAEGEGIPERENHVRSTRQVAADVKADAIADATGGSTIRTHKQADKIAAELGIAFEPDATVADKVAAIESFNAAAALETDAPEKDDDESVADAQHGAAAGSPEGDA